MGFKENLLRKIKINGLAAKVRLSLKPSDPPRRIDRESMQAMLEMADYTYRRERDLDLYSMPPKDDGKQLIIVLDNELKLYNTTIMDVALRKSPTVKEMVSIRNAIKILNDKDVVISSKTDTLQRVQQELLDALDLSFNEADIEGLVHDGQGCLKNNYTEGIVETLTLFSEILGFEKPPKAFRIRHQHIWASITPSSPGAVAAGPIVIFSLIHNQLKMILKPIHSNDKSAMQRFEQIAADQEKADLAQEEVFNELKKMAMQKL